MFSQKEIIMKDGTNSLNLIAKVQQKLALQGKLNTIECLKKAQSGDEKAKELVICNNLKLVYKIAYKYTSNKTHNYDDLFSIGLVGLVKAVDRFNCEKSVEFSTFAYRCIENEILMSFRKNKDYNNAISLEEYVVDNEKSQNKINLEQTLVDPKQTKNLVDAENKILVEQLLGFAKKRGALNEVELQILDLKYGLTDGNSHSLAEVAQILNRKLPNVSKIHSKAMLKLCEIAKKERIIYANI